ncbi:PH domain-containing protein [Paucibacter sp. DJ1R-11]|uniref:PH domain-containing protein n=1 Tax=Paucibacter sp. DJ1R-11 TaxID=2893556 RepID=UPI0021E49802|nr:PH domain-containing protein [Paucibacter sp. DJ1R-11]MCV2364805.1 PH domain-containing protein [Paucibacter sp. DJ1R-11]
MNEPAAAAAAITPLGKLPALRGCWRLVTGLGLGLAGLAVPVLAELIVQEQPEDLNGLRWLLWSLPVLGLLFGLWLADRRFVLYGAELHAGEGVVLRRGVWWRSEIWVPMARLQHLDVSQGPLDRLWGMASLSLHTAGSHDHHTSIHGLPLAQAHALRDTLLPRQRAEHD